MNPNRFFVPRIGTNVRPMMSSGYIPTRGDMGLLGKITNSLRSFNWSGLLNGANKTLNVVNQTIPLVRQAGPMFNNLKSMMRLAKVFGNETGNKNSRRNNIINQNNINKSVTNEQISNNSEKYNTKKEVENNSYPHFFI